MNAIVQLFEDYLALEQILCLLMKVKEESEKVG